ncbi:MAG: hypothetical protein ACTTJY_04630 [Hoylesella shahii]|uniref:hypothetical protein n=1 Tax=Hoylesella shahii TaxID=228603 RepID=UPI003FA0BB4A
MKKQILTLTLMFTASLVVNAQYSTGVAQLKNEHLAFATSAETMPTCLNYAQSTGRTAQPYTANKSNVTFNANPSAKETPAAYAAPASELQIARGFKGFVEPSYSLSFDGNEYNRFGFTVSLGSQIFPKLFVGGGIGLEYYPDSELNSFPIFADVRFNFKNKGITPFIGMKVGYVISKDFYGLYFNPSFGYRFGLTKKLALHAAVGYVMQTMNSFDDNNNVKYNFGSVYISANDIEINSCIKLQVGFEF